MRRLMMIALIPFAVALFPVTAYAGVDGLAVAPAHPDPANAATRSYFVHTASPGETFTDQVRVSNGGATPLELLVSPVDGLTGATSGAVYANRQDVIAKAGAWVTPTRSSLRLSSGSTTYLDFSVRVPQDAPPGDHLGGIAFEDAHPSTNGTGLQVTTVVRAVIGVLVQVPGPAVFDLRVSDAVIEPLTPTLNLATVKIRLEDVGLLLGRPTLTVRLTGPNGYRGVVADRRLDTLLPGDPILYPLPWPDALAPGDYAIDVAGSAAGMIAPSRVHATVHLGTTLVPTTPASTPPPPAVTATAAPDSGFVIAPRVLLIAAGATALLLAMFAVMLRLARRARTSSARLG
jgi:hypothetical protein